MHRILKYQLEIKDEQKIKVPCCSKLLKLNVQKDVPCLWVLVDIDEIKSNNFEYKVLVMKVTGEEFKYDSDEMEYIDSFFIDDGCFVGHVFCGYRVSAGAAHSRVEQR